MTAENKKRALKDILSELDKEKKSAPTQEKDDITGLEQKIPIVGKSTDKDSGGIINFEDEAEASDVEIPIPEGFAMKEDTGEFNILGMENKEAAPSPPTPVSEAKTNPKIIVSELRSRPSSPTPADTDYLNKTELLEQRILMLEEENKKQAKIMSSQKKEIEEYRERIGKLDSENRKIIAELSSAEGNVRMDFEAQLNKAAVIEEKYNTLAQNHEEMKAKVRKDIQKIRMREKELANKLDMIKNDSETLLAAKDHKILQLKQHIDNLEFEIESLKEKVTTFQDLAKENEEKAERVIKALRLSTSLLETGSKKE
ncbi:MAG: hypothetical protein V1647_04570 [Pseudomonadota bacterium]